MLTNALKLTTVAAASLWLSGVARAAIIAAETWDTPADLRDWEMTDFSFPGGPQTVGAEYATFSVPAAFGNPASAVEIDVSAAPVFPVTDTFRTDGGVYGDNFASPLGVNYTFVSVNEPQTDSVEFDFYLNGVAQGGGFNSLQFYFVGGGAYWYYFVDVSSQAANTWQRYAVPMSYDPLAWYSPTFTTFATDLISVTEVGFTLSYLTDDGAGTYDGQLFGFDNFSRTYQVPEPETYATIGFALVGLGIAFRRRITDVMALARTRLAI